MSFPVASRVRFGKNPLEEVICQLKFPAILRIGTEPPSVFQDHIRKQYPVVRERTSADLDTLLTGIPAAVAQAIVARFPQGLAAPTYDFVSADSNWTVTLTRESIALTSNKYETWDEFTTNFRAPLSALLSVYEPAYYTRLGLRYRNRIDRDVLGLAGCTWSDLLSPHIAGILSSPMDPNDIEAVQTTAILRLDEPSGRVRIQHGTSAGKDQAIHYLVDSDFFTDDRTETTDADRVLNGFNKRAGHLFQWCITDRLRDAMDQEPAR